MALPPLLPVSYAELHCLSNFTFLQGASFPEELVERASQLGYKALAITDECSLSGVVRAYIAARPTNLQLIIGSRFVLEDGVTFVLLARNRHGYGQMSNLITLARRRAPKGLYHIDRELVESQRLEECLALWIPTGCKNGEDGDDEGTGQWLSNVFSGRLWIAVELLLQGTDKHKLAALQLLGQRLDLPLVAAGAVTMHVAERRALRDTLTAIRLGRRLDELGYEIAQNGEQHLRSPERLAKLYPPELLAETVRIASLCEFSLAELRYEYPHELVPAGHTASSWLRDLTERGMHERWPNGASGKVRRLIEKELSLVAELRYEHFFLTVHDIVAFARGQNILCQGRGSAANSVICYCLNITEVDPQEMDLLFERFLSKERDEAPDIDVDFEHERREEVIQYIYQKYGRHRAALAATVICYRARSAIRDVAKTFGLHDSIIEKLSKSVDWYGNDIDEQIEAQSVKMAPDVLHRLIILVRTLIGFPRHLSQHVGGFVISQGPLSELVPVENASMADRTVIQWEKDDLEALGLLKVDVLALGILTMIRKALELISASTGKPLDMAMIPRSDEQVYDMICNADTVGVFQIESRAQMSMLPRLKPRNYYDLVVQIAIVRPGPIQGNMVHPYLARRTGREPPDYPSKDIESVLKRTLGIPIFQEQVMQIAIVAAGFTGGEADQLRRAMAAWKKKGGLEPFREKLIDGMTKRGYAEEFALRIYNQIKGFGEYGFPESHSASFALLAYVSSWLKYHYPAQFCCALLNSQPMGFYGPAQLVQDARRHEVTVRPVDVNCSAVDCTLEPEGEGGNGVAVRLGLRLVKGLSSAGAQRVYEGRESGIYSCIQTLVERTGINRSDRESLAAADAFSALASDRHRAFWDVAGYEEKLPLYQTQGEQVTTSTDNFTSPLDNQSEVEILLPKPSEAQDIFADYTSIGLTLRRHPLALLRNHLQQYHVIPASLLSTLRDGSCIKVVGIVTSRQRPQTASGVTFMTLEDETGFINVVVWSTLYEQHRLAVRGAYLLGVIGTVQISEGVVHVVARNLVDLSEWISGMTIQSRDFC